MSTVLSKGSRNQTSKFAQEDRIVTSGVTLNDGDFVAVASDQWVLATAAIQIHGVIRGGQSDNLVSKNYRAPTIVGDGTKKASAELVEGQRFQLTASAALASDAAGKYYCLTGATGAQQVDNTTKSATVGQLLCLRRVADSTGAFTLGIFTVSSPQSQVAI